MKAASSFIAAYLYVDRHRTNVYYKPTIFHVTKMCEVNILRIYHLYTILQTGF